MKYKNRKKLIRKISKIKKQGKKKLKKLRNYRDKYLENKDYYFRENRKQALKMKPDVKKIRF